MTGATNDVRAIVFDRDGVLTHFDWTPALALLRGKGLSIQGLLPFWATWCRDHALPRTDEAERGFLSGFWELVCRQSSLGDDARRELEAFDYTVMMRPYDDALAALRASRERGLRVGVLSNFPLPSVTRSLAAAGLVDWVDVAVGAAEIGARKPEPEAYRHVLERLGTPPSACVLFDDEPECVEGARAIGIRAHRVDRCSTPEPGALRDLWSIGAVLDGAP